MSIPQFELTVLVFVWSVCCIWWGIAGARDRYQRRLVRTKPTFPVMDFERGRQLHAIVKGTDRLRTGYQQGRDYR